MKIARILGEDRGRLMTMKRCQFDSLIKFDGNEGYDRERERISRDDGGFSLAARGNVNSIRCDESKFLKCPKEENLF